MSEKKDFKGISIEEESDEDEEPPLRCFSEDGELHKYVPKPGIQFDFETEGELKAFMKKLTETGIMKEGGKAFVKNVSEDFFEGFNDILKEQNGNTIQGTSPHR